MCLKSFLCLLYFAFFSVCFAANSSLNADRSLNENISAYTADLDAKIGVAVIGENGVDASINADTPFPMLSVMKFPLALYICRICDNKGISLTDSIDVDKSYLHTDTYSPMLKKYPPVNNYRIPISELLEYALKYSDNNAADILIEFAGGTSVIDQFIAGLGYDGIKLKWTENEMHQDINRSFENTSTPMAMACLMRDFDRNYTDGNSLHIKHIMENCETGTDRLVKYLIKEDAVTGHKTGTGFIINNRIQALNDAGYVNMPDGQRYSIAVFVADSGLTSEETSEIIAKISRIVYDHMIKPHPVETHQ